MFYFMKFTERIITVMDKMCAAWCQSFIKYFSPKSAPTSWPDILVRAGINEVGLSAGLYFLQRLDF